MYGARVKGEHGVTQIDGLYSDMIVVHEGTASPNSYSNNSPTQISLPSGVPADCIIVFRPVSDSTDGAAWGDYDPATRQFYFRGAPGDFWPGNIRYRILVKESQAPETGGLYGIRIKRAGTGELVFSSRRSNRLKVGGVIVATGGPPANFLYNGPDGTQAWAIINDPGLYGFANDESEFPPVLRMYRAVYQFNWAGDQSDVLVGSYFDGGGWAGLSPITINTQRAYMFCYF